MHKDTLIAETEGYKVTKLLSPEFSPAIITPGADICPWVEMRSIDVHRSNRDIITWTLINGVLFYFLSSASASAVHGTAAMFLSA